MLAYLLSLLEADADKFIFNQMYGQYKQLTLRITRAVLQNRQDAEDATMAAWIKVIEHFDTAKEYFYKSKKDFEPWLTVVTRNAARDECRRRKRAPKPIDLRVIPSSADPEKEAIIRMAVESLQSLPDEMRAVLVMRVISGYSFKEIGKVLGCSENAAEKRFKRAQAEWNKRMGEKRK